MDHHHGGHSTVDVAANMPQHTAHPHQQEGHATVFFGSQSTPLYSHQWTPTSAGSYAATCIFLIILAITARCLIAFKSVLEQRWKTALLNRERDALAAKSSDDAGLERSGLDTKMGTVSTAQGVDGDGAADGKMLKHSAPFQPMVDLSRALLATVITGVSFLLMLAVMTMNIGYFCSILGGTFLGELAVGRYNHIITR